VRLAGFWDVVGVIAGVEVVLCLDCYLYYRQGLRFGFYGCEFRFELYSPVFSFDALFLF